MSTDLKYPYNWGKRIVNDFVEIYPRGTYYLSKMLGISPGELRHQLIVVLCMAKHVKFKALKKIIKQNDINSPDEFKHLALGNRIKLYKCIYANAVDEVLDEYDAQDALDKQKN